MPVPDSCDVTLVDPALLSCWEEKVKQGVECSLLLEYTKGKVTTILKCTMAKKPNARAPKPLSSSQAEKKMTKKKNKGGKKKRLEALLSYHQRLVEEKGLPPSRLMLQHAAVVPAPSPPKFSCEQCEFSSTSQRGVKVHIGRAHKESQKPETLRDEDKQSNLNHSQQSVERVEETNTSNVEEESEEEEEHSSPSPQAHKCPAFYPCTRPECQDTDSEEEDPSHECPAFLPCARLKCQ